MKDAAKGQIVRSSFEGDLGLGRVVEVDGPQFRVEFPVARALRSYRSKESPIERVVLSPGTIFARTTKHSTITDPQIETGGKIRGLAQAPGPLYWYAFEDGTVSEADIDILSLRDTRLEPKVAMGGWTDPRFFDLAADALRLRLLYQSDSRLAAASARVSLMPHQLYVLKTVTQRLFPRFLLSDEVGLGKTIEALMIFLALKAQGRGSRALIVVPESLKHQWLSEVFRRSGELFVLIDSKRFQAERATSDLDAFEFYNQIILTSEALSNPAFPIETLLRANWDLLIVDEAHHARWSSEDREDKPSLWSSLSKISARSQAVFCLTATPGLHDFQSFFGLLRLLDPKRFFNQERFKKMFSQLADISALADHVLTNGFDQTTHKMAAPLLQNDPELATLWNSRVASQPKQEKISSNDPLIRALLDRYGVGRVLIRNRRERIWTEQRRCLHLHPLESPVALKDKASSTTPFENIGFAFAEKHLKEKCQWLKKWIPTGPRKVLCITHTATAADKYFHFINQNIATKVACFHEDMDVIERDRQAAYFADPNGAQVLVCSEIGGEGRNFQFAQDLVLLDLSPIPELLEQRIGRLDRIGQKGNVNIHVPFIQKSLEEQIIDLHTNLTAVFSSPWVRNIPFKELFEGRLMTSLTESTTRDQIEPGARKSIFDDIKEFDLHTKGHQDRLIDINSFDERSAIEELRAVEQIEKDTALEEFCLNVFDLFNLEVESSATPGVHHVSAHELMFVSQFPGFETQSTRSLCFSRGTAEVREDLGFLRLGHPMVQGILSMILDRSDGQISAASVPADQLEHALVIETLFSMGAPLEFSGVVPARSKSMIIRATIGGKILSSTWPKLNLRPLTVTERQKALQAIGRLSEKLTNSFAAIHLEAEHELTSTRNAQRVEICEKWDEEISRARHLARINPLFQDEEVSALEELKNNDLIALDRMKPQLHAIRLLFRSAG